MIGTASYVETVIGFLESFSMHFSPGHNVWRSALLSSSIAAKYESEKYWPLVSKCCKNLIELDCDLNNTIVTEGLNAAFQTRDAVLASDIVMRVLNSSSPNMGEEQQGSSLYTGHDSVRLSTSTLFHVIELCISSKRPELACSILSECSSVDWLKIPNITLSELTTTVITGYAQIGDASNAERIFHRMDSDGLTKR